MKMMLMRATAAVTVMLAMGISAPKAQAQTIQADLLKDWTGMKATMDKIAAEMPDDKYTFKSTPAQRDFAAQVMHIATTNVFLVKLLGAKAAAPMINDKATSKADVVKALDASFDYGTEAIKELTDATILQPVAMAPGFLGPSSKARIVYSAIGHTWDIYGQMAVYLRLNGKVPPASQRP